MRRMTTIAVMSCLSFLSPEKKLARRLQLLRCSNKSGGDGAFVARPTLRDATLKDAPLLRRWDQKTHIQEISGDPDYNDWDWDYELSRGTISWRKHLIAQAEDGTPIGFVFIMDPKEEESHYWGTDCASGLRALDIWIGEEDYLGRGYGTEMMKLALNEHCFSNRSVEAVLVDPLLSNVRAHRFYQQCGFRPVGLRKFGPDECLVHQLDRQDWESVSHGWQQ